MTAYLLFRIFRIPNLIIIWLTLFMVRFLVFEPIYKAQGIGLNMSSLHFTIMVFITVLTAVFGYVLNDYYDVGTDRINRPEKLYIGNIVDPGFVFTSLGIAAIVIVALSIVLSSVTHSVLPAAFLLSALAITILYAARLKKSFVWGNLAVASMTASTILMIWLTEQYALTINGFLKLNAGSGFKLTEIVVMLSLFAFLLNFAREIVKDMEDAEGDRAIGCRSIPIVLGFRKSKLIVLSTCALVMILITFSAYMLNEYKLCYSSIWLILACGVPLLWFGFKFGRSQTRVDFHMAGNLLKYIMLGGLLTMVAAQF